MSEIKILYSEPADYFPKDVREDAFPELEVDSVKYNEIARTILGGILEEAADKNIVFSPYSVYTLLNILKDSTSGNTRNEVAEFLGIAASDSVDTLSIINRHLKKDRQFRSVNAALVKNKLEKHINKEYIDMLKEKYGAEFFASADLINDVNKWVKKQTNGMIPEIADETMKEMVAALLNAVTFKASWKKKYEEDDIGEGDFTNTDKSLSEVSMMCSTEDHYIENEFFTGFIKPYRGGEFSYMGLRPRKNSKSFLRRAVRGMSITELYDDASKAEVRASIPEYKVEFEKNLSSLLKSNGVTQAFKDDADFTPMSSDTPLKVEKILHKAYIEVDRRGTKASAVTFSEIAIGCAPSLDEVKYVDLDHPFVYAIIHNKTHLPVFLGVVNQL